MLRNAFRDLQVMWERIMSEMDQQFRESQEPQGANHFTNIGTITAYLDSNASRSNGFSR